MLTCLNDHPKRLVVKDVATDTWRGIEDESEHRGGGWRHLDLHSMGPSGHAHLSLDCIMHDGRMICENVELEQDDKARSMRTPEEWIVRLLGQFVGKARIMAPQGWKQL